MLGRIFREIRSFFRMLANMRRGMRKAPDYVVLTIKGDYPTFSPPAGNFITRRLRQQQTSLRELIVRFRKIAYDERVKGVVIYLRPLTMASAKIEDLREAIKEVREAGKRVVVWSYTYDRKMMYLASAADAIYALPGAPVDALGVASLYQYFAEPLARVGVQADVVRVSPYKSAGDPFLRSSMSDEVREMTNWLIEATYEEFVGALAEGRGMSEGQAREVIDSTPCTDLEATELGLIDAIVQEKDLPHLLGEGTDPARLMTWKQASRTLKLRPLPKMGQRVAVLPIEGIIMDGTSSRPPVEPPVPVPLIGGGQAGDRTVASMARAVAQDKRIGAVVVWVDSRGGSATASEAMASALEEIRAEKPVIVAMGSVAASGGYYVATPGQTIIAQPSTLTGSIGVIILKLGVAGVLDKLDIGREIIKRGEHAEFLVSPEAFSEEERRIRAESMQRTYEIFTDRVKASRNLTPEALGAVAGGRVWTGRQALHNGLVDALGGLDTAVDKARELGGLHENCAVQLITPPQQPILPQANTDDQDDAQQPAARTMLGYMLGRLTALSRPMPLCLLPIEEL